MIDKLKNEVNVLIPDGDSQLIMFVINLLSVFKNINIHIISSKKWVESRFSRNIESFTFYKQTSNEKDFIAFLRQEIQKRNIEILIPIMFSSIRLISTYKSLFEALHLKIVISTISSLDIANNKWKLSKFLKNNKLPSPDTFHLHHIDKSDFDKLKYPLILKPLSSWNGNEIIKISDRIGLDDLLLKINTNKEYILQEYISGSDFCINVICLNGEILAHTIQKGILPKSNPYQPHMGFEFLEDKELLNLTKIVMSKLNWSGVANFDIRFNREKNQYYIIEINPRFWGSVEASAMIGVNFPYLMCLLSLNTTFKTPEYRFENFITNRGMLKRLKSKFLFEKNRNVKFHNNSLHFSVRDPLPKIFKYLFKTLKRLLPKRFFLDRTKMSTSKI